jgi:diaminohydroxyphosphoribosylaminopyrimidine deaminase / 5-amino-6-(5-phosphoribosylamino)uracil reductase
LVYNHSDKERPDLIARGATLIQVSPADSATQLHEVLHDVSHRGANEILIESGPTLAGAFLSAGLVDEVWLYLAPKLLGDGARAMAALTVPALAQAPQFKLQDCRVFGEDLRLIYRCKGAE